MAKIEFSNVVASVGTSYTALLAGTELDLLDFKACGMTVNNTGGTAFSGFELRIRHEGGAELPFLTSSGDFSGALRHPLLAVAPNNVFTLAGGTSTLVELWVMGYRYMQIYAKVASGSTSASVYGILK